MGGRDRLLLRILSGRRNHRPLYIGLRCKGALLLGRRRNHRHGWDPAGFPKHQKTDQYGRGERRCSSGFYRKRSVPCSRLRGSPRNGARSLLLRGGQGSSYEGTFCQAHIHIRAALTRAGVPVAGYSRHSFRIGVVMAAAQARIPDSTIQALGHGTCSAFLDYIWTPTEQLAEFTQPLARRP